MRQYILNRLLLMIPTLVGVAVLVFLMLRVAPGDIVEMKYAGTGAFAPKETLDRERAQLGLDKPLLHQFISWINPSCTSSFPGCGESPAWILAIPCGQVGRSFMRLPFVWS